MYKIREKDTMYGWNFYFLEILVKNIAIFSVRTRGSLCVCEFDHSIKGEKSNTQIERSLPAKYILLVKLSNIMYESF